MLPLFNDTILLDKIPIRVSTEAIRLKDNLHFHRRIQLCFVLSGELKHTICDKEYIQKAGSCAFILPYMPHIINSIESEDTPLVVHIWFHENFFKEYSHDILSYGENTHFNGYKIPLVCDFPEQGDAPVQIIRKLVSEFAREKDLSIKKLAELTSDLFTLACTEPIPKKCDSLFKKQLACVEDSINYIEKHFPEKLSLDDLCNVSGMSRRSFTSHFKHITKLTPLQYMLSVRIQSAFRLIMEKRLCFDEIAQKSGLGNNSNLTRVFLKNLGVTPSNFVEKYIKNTNISHAQSVYSRYKWLYELQSSFHTND